MLNAANSLCSKSRDELSLAGKQDKKQQTEISQLNEALLKKDNELDMSRELLVAADERFEKDKNVWFATIEKLEKTNKINEEKIKRLEEERSKSTVSETKLKNEVDKLKHIIEEKDKELETTCKGHDVVVAEWRRSCQQITEEVKKKSFILTRFLKLIFSLSKRDLRI
jgi:chromosome segregation ATPase